MIRTKALTVRILKQIIHDKRTMALILVAPLFILTLVYFILNAENSSYEIGAVGVSDSFISILEDTEDVTIHVTNIKENQIEDQMKEDKIDAAIQINDKNQLSIYLSGADVGVASKLQMIIKAAFSQMAQKSSMNQAKSEIHVQYVIGKEDGTLFDKFGTQLIGIIIYFFVFLIAGIQFLGERTSGTLEKLLSTPIRRWEIVVGYVLGFSLLSLIQSVLVTLFAVYILGLSVTGSIWYVLLVILLTSMNALTLGILLSTVANSEFQMMQFIPIVILPQIFLCGLFSVAGIWGKLGYIMPLHYTSHALIEVMIKGNGFGSIWVDVVLLLGISIVFVLINILLLKKQRRI